MRNKTKNKLGKKVWDFRIFLCHHKKIFFVIEHSGDAHTHAACIDSRPVCEEIGAKWIMATFWLYFVQFTRFLQYTNVACEILHFFNSYAKVAIIYYTPVAGRTTSIPDSLDNIVHGLFK